MSIGFAYIFCHASELFPTKFRVFILSFSLFFSRMSATIVPYLESIEDYFGIHPFSCCVVSSLLILPVLIFMPETKGKRLLD